MPDLTILLELSPDGRRKRLDQRCAPDAIKRYDTAKESYFEKVQAGYLELQAKHPDRIKHVSADGTEEEVFERVWAAVRPVIETRYGNLDRVLKTFA